MLPSRGVRPHSRAPVMGSMSLLELLTFFLHDPLKQVSWFLNQVLPGSRCSFADSQRQHASA